MPTAYASVATHCARILNGRVKFSNALMALAPDTKNKGALLMQASGIAMNSSYYGKNITFEFRFVNALDLTEYRVYRQTSADGPKNMMYVHTGHTNINETIAGVATINSSAWVGGPPALNDIFYMITDSNMSIVDGDDLMNDIEADVDDTLRRHAVITTPETTIPTGLHFVLNPPIPRAINIAAKYMFCYRIMNDLFKAGRNIKPATGKEELTDEDFALAYQWQKIAVASLKEYINMYNVQKVGNAPKWIGLSPIQSVIGIDGVGPGVVGQETDGDYTESDADIIADLRDKSGF